MLITGSSVHLLITSCLSVPAMSSGSLMARGPAAHGDLPRPSVCWPRSSVASLIAPLPIAFPLTRLHIYSWPIPGFWTRTGAPGTADDFRLARSEEYSTFGSVPDLLSEYTDIRTLSESFGVDRSFVLSRRLPQTIIVGINITHLVVFLNADYTE